MNDKMILLIDNYDSFVYNLARYVNQLGFFTKVVRNNAVTINDVIKLKPSKIIISPGPCDPSKAGVSLEIIKFFGKNIPILGVCLGHQAIGQAYGGKIIRAKSPMHGKKSVVMHNGNGIFKDIPSPFNVGRYHSLVVDKHFLPESLNVIAESEDSEIMALMHKEYPVYGVQFHPESIITEKGYHLLENFLMINI